MSCNVYTYKLVIIMKNMTSIEFLAIKVEINFRMGMLLQWN